jgi:hypothetical protein
MAFVSNRQRISLKLQAKQGSVTMNDLSERIGRPFTSVKSELWAPSAVETREPIRGQQRQEVAEQRISAEMPQVVANS